MVHGQWFAPSEFWRMPPAEFWWHVEARQAKASGRTLTESDYAELYADLRAEQAAERASASGSPEGIDPRPA